MENPGAWRAQRLWLLERMDDDRLDVWRDVCRFTGAIGVLSEGAIYILFIRSPEAQSATADRLGRPGLRWDLARDAARFATLDAAIEWADERKRDWIARGWVEVHVEESLHRMRADTRRV